MIEHDWPSTCCVSVPSSALSTLSPTARVVNHYGAYCQAMFLHFLPLETRAWEAPEWKYFIGCLYFGGAPGQEGLGVVGSWEILQISFGPAKQLIWGKSLTTTGKSVLLPCCPGEVNMPHTLLYLGLLGQRQLQAALPAAAQVPVSHHAHVQGLISL